MFPHLAQVVPLSNANTHNTCLPSQKEVIRMLSMLGSWEIEESFVRDTRANDEHVIDISTYIEKWNKQSKELGRNLIDEKQYTKTNWLENKTSQKWNRKQIEEITDIKKPQERESETKSYERNNNYNYINNSYNNYQNNGNSNSNNKYRPKYSKERENSYSSRHYERERSRENRDWRTDKYYGEDSGQRKEYPQSDYKQRDIYHRDDYRNDYRQQEHYERKDSYEKQSYNSNANYYRSNYGHDYKERQSQNNSYYDKKSKHQQYDY